MMKVWFDADNAPHVLIVRPLTEELARQGHEIRFTARDRTSTCQLMDLYGIKYIKVGGEYGPGFQGKVRGTLGRAWALARTMRGWRADVSFGHGSRALPIASRLLGVPSVTMYDYEWVNPVVFNSCCRTILLPEAIDMERCREAGIRCAKVKHYPGYKENLYLKGPFFTADLMRELGLDHESVNVLLRPPATSAHYHNPEAEVILRAILQFLTSEPKVCLVYLARERDQLAFLEGHRFPKLIVPKKVYDGPTLVSCMDVVIGGGGTMTREAAVLGIPSYSFFRGRTGRVDESLEAAGVLLSIRAPIDVGRKLRIAKRATGSAPRENSELARIIVERIKAAVC